MGEQHWLPWRSRRDQRQRATTTQRAGDQAVRRRGGTSRRGSGARVHREFPGPPPKGALPAVGRRRSAIRDNRCSGMASIAATATHAQTYLGHFIQVLEVRTLIRHLVKTEDPPHTMCVATFTCIMYMASETALVKHYRAA